MRDVAGESLHEIERVVGKEAFEKLIAAFGGLELEVSSGVGSQYRMRIEAVIGGALGVKFCRHFDGNRIYIPKNEKSIKRARNQQIVNEYDSGSSVRDLSLRYYLSEKQIRNILGKPV